MSSIISISADTAFPMVAGVEVTTDDQGRFNLNALHKASKEGEHKKPSKWLQTQQAQELVFALNSQSPNSDFGDNSTTYEPLNIIRGGHAPGTFAHELLAVSYAGWINPVFQLTVNQTFIDYRTNKLKPSLEALNAALDERDALLKAEIFAEVNRLIENKRFLTQRKVLRSMDVGEQLGITAREFNRTAVELGLMTAHRCGPDDTLAFLLTNEGMKYGRMATGGKRFHERGYTFSTTMWWVEDVIGYVKSFDGQRLTISIPGKPKHGRKEIPMSQSAIEALNKVH